MKAYGKLTLEQFRNLVGKLPEVKGQRGEMVRRFSEMSDEKFDALTRGGVNWGTIYERPFVEHIALAFVGFGRADWVATAAAAADPQQHVLDAMDDEDDAPGELPPGVEDRHLIGLAFSIQNNFLSILLYQRSVSTLVRDVREKGDLDSLFKAVRVDRAVMSCPTIAHEIARAELRGDQGFFTKLRNALKGPSRKHWAWQMDLRYAFAVLRECGLDDLSDDELEQLMVHDLKVYPDIPAARKNLRAQYQRSRKLGTI